LEGEVPQKWSSIRHFSDEKRYKGLPDVQCISGPWYNHGHLVTIVLCREYWTILDPLTDENVIDLIVYENVKNVIKHT